MSKKEPSKLVIRCDKERIVVGVRSLPYQWGGHFVTLQKARSAKPKEKSP